MRRTVAVALVLLGALALAALPAQAQTGSDVPGNTCHPVSGIDLMPSNAASGPSGGVVWQALSLAVRQNVSLGFWRWLPMNTDPSMARNAPTVQIPRRQSLRLGGWSKP